MANFRPIPEEVLDYYRYDHETGHLYYTKKLSKRTVVGTRAGADKTVTSSSRVSKEDNPYTYRVVRFKGVDYCEHRVIWFMVHGEQADEQIDHRNNDATDNRIENLRLMSQAGNMQNTSLRTDNVSGQKGVALRSNNTWRAYINFGGKRINLGTYDNVWDAIDVRKWAEEEYGFNDDERIYTHAKPKVQEEDNDE